ncbi:hypothetical protein [Blochmannia endosymbiont of Camponotus sp.]|uniref:hypothetical protein n=1 Tax=Blochmannia endosymbiont of Camponotus sp. TaxID=700220 RepID=UPI002024A44F|nr:hypothetical protein [Blochmannia endosymbiont of Camponotus sp.]URJ24154.1 hypothetical protein M9403_01445 [Blochmannia endosymbiont of Camponotus sp.]
MIVAVKNIKNTCAWKCSNNQISIDVGLFLTSPYSLMIKYRDDNIRGVVTIVNKE